jgi:hypothetical protein
MKKNELRSATEVQKNLWYSVLFELTINYNNTITTGDFGAGHPSQP